MPIATEPGTTASTVGTAPLSNLLHHIDASVDPVTARVRNLRAIGAAAGLSAPALDAPRDEWSAWTEAVGCCRGLDPVIPAPYDPVELVEASGWSVRDIESVATANVGGAPMPVVARGDFRTVDIQTRLGGRSGQVVTLGTPGEFDLDARSPLRPQGQPVSFLYDETMILGGYEPSDVEAAVSPGAPLAERDDIVEALGVVDGSIDDLLIETGGWYFVATEFLLCLPRCQDGFDLAVAQALPVPFSSVMIGYDHTTQRATMVWVHPDPVSAERNAPELTDFLDGGALGSAGSPYRSLIVDPVVEVSGRSLVVTSTVSPTALNALIEAASASEGIFGLRVMQP